MKFAKTFLKELLEESDPKVVVEDKICDHRRWSVDFRLIFRFDGKLYATYYSRGATESQDERPYEYDSDEIECPEVVAVPATAYEVKK